MKTLLCEAHLARLNSLTKYPSIPTYHAMGAKGRLEEAVQVPFESEVILSEKIDGTNARLICTPEGVLVGSREDLLWATGDLIHNPAMSIVPAVREHALALRASPASAGLLVIYGEVYGRSIGAAARHYTKAGGIGFRVFDAFEMSAEAVFASFAESPERISAWRESGGQPFLSVDALDALAHARGWARVPALGVLPAAEMPRTHEAAAAFLAAYHHTRAALEADVVGQAEGVVARSRDRRQIAKLRFEDYQRTRGR